MALSDQLKEIGRVSGRISHLCSAKDDPEKKAANVAVYLIILMKIASQGAESC